MNRLTAWDAWVLVCFAYTTIGYTIVGWMAFHPADATAYGFAAAAACFVWAFAGLICADRVDGWLA